MVVVRLLGGEQAWREGLAALRDQPRPVVVVGGELLPDAALMALSTVPAGVGRPGPRLPGPRRHRQPARAGPLPDRHGAAGRHRLRGARARRRPGGSGPGRTDSTAAAHGRDHLLPGPRAGRATPASWTGWAWPSRAWVRGRCRSGAPACAPPSPACSTVLGQADALVVTVLAAGGVTPALAQAGGDDEAWDIGAIAALDVPIAPGAVPDRAAASSGRPPTRA